MHEWERNKLFGYVASCARLDLWNNITNLFVCIEVVHRPTEFDPPEGSNWKWIKNQTFGDCKINDGSSLSNFDDGGSSGGFLPPTSNPPNPIDEGIQIW